ncbi:DUF2515 family protein [Rossellomorea marisflavi]|uniref:DUF2515 family protein n=1 Tax=Rossellomorea marisflavi TaxID=189381 RepID=UPI00207AFF8B|nr:DUF2515 family protein [Rossellomorea marisflavi]USK90500.1 DUF2515 domain-containing protein [Rossellomorea marisflavi]
MSRKMRGTVINGTIPLLPVQEAEAILQPWQEDQPILFFPDDRKRLRHMEGQTTLGNRDNLTRTARYLSFYRKHPEIHWVFLAHMVSRNAGYYMTDLRGSLLSGVMPRRIQREFFSFLETCNAAIFEDAYPQLMLYEEWKERGSCNWSLLSKFQVSSFMKPFWQAFFKSGDSSLLTTALIINEQMLIENRIVSQWMDQKDLTRWLFTLQDSLGLTSILFPYGEGPSHSLAGQTIYGFDNVHARIEAGKKLYRILFHPHIHQSSLRYALLRRHTASRQDYWPRVYSNNPSNIRTLYSPRLVDAWPDAIRLPYPSRDWYKGDPSEIKRHLMAIPPPGTFTLTKRWRKAVSGMLKSSSKDY